MGRGEGVPWIFVNFHVGGRGGAGQGLLFVGQDGAWQPIFPWSGCLFFHGALQPIFPRGRAAYFLNFWGSPVPSTFSFSISAAKRFNELIKNMFF